MVGSADPGRRIRDFAGPRLRQCDQILRRFCRQRRVHDEQIGHYQHQRDRCEVALQIIGQVLEDQRPGAQRIDRHQQRVAVGRRFDHALIGETRAGTQAVDHHHLPLEALTEVACEQTRHRIGAATRARRHDELDRFGRELILSNSDAAGSGKGAGGEAVDCFLCGCCHRFLRLRGSGASVVQKRLRPKV